MKTYCFSHMSDVPKRDEHFIYSFNHSQADTKQGKYRKKENTEVSAALSRGTIISTAYNGFWNSGNKLSLFIPFFTMLILFYLGKLFFFICVIIQIFEWRRDTAEALQAMKKEHRSNGGLFISVRKKIFSSILSLLFYQFNHYFPQNSWKKP